MKLTVRHDSKNCQKMFEVTITAQNKHGQLGFESWPLTVLCLCNRLQRVQFKQTPFTFFLFKKNMPGSEAACVRALRLECVCV